MRKAASVFGSATKGARIAFGFDEMNHCQVSEPWGGRSSRLTSFEPHSSKSRPQANLPIMVVGLPGDALPLVERQESICARSNASICARMMKIRGFGFGGGRGGIDLLTQVERELTQ